MLRHGASQSPQICESVTADLLSCPSIEVRLAAGALLPQALPPSQEVATAAQADPSHMGAAFARYKMANSQSRQLVGQMPLAASLVSHAQYRIQVMLQVRLLHLKS